MTGHQGRLYHPVLGIPPVVFQRLNGWDEAITRLREFVDPRRDLARERAAAFHARYEGARAAMVFDVVHSANRSYSLVEGRVVSLEGTPAGASLAALAELGPPDTTGFKRFELESMCTLAKRLAGFGRVRGVTDDHACRAWAAESAPATVFGLDPTIGRIKGIAVTQYAYLRMRCGGQDIKPDRHVADVLAGFGFQTGSAAAHVHAVAHAAAQAVDIRPLELDQLLWAGRDG